MAEITAPYATTEHAFRRLMGSLPSGVTVVTATSGEGPRGMTCSSLVSVCLEPATLAVCLRSVSLTRTAVLEHGRFAVNLLNARAERAARVFSTDVADRFALVAWRASGTGMPLLTEDACAWAECDVSGTVEIGDHTMIFGTVTDSCVVSGAPLVYARQSFRSWDALPPARHHPPEGERP